MSEQGFKILLEARSWGAALAAIAEDEPETLRIVNEHDAYIKAKVRRETLLDAAEKYHQLLIADKSMRPVTEWLRAQAEPQASEQGGNDGK